MLRRIFVILLGLMLLAALLGGCKPVTAPAAAPAEPAATAAGTGTATPEAAQEGAGLANPASVFCAQNGGKLEIRNEANGQVGYCVFGDGSECEEWAYLRGECAPGQPKAPANMPNPASVNCEKQGGTLEIRKDAGGGEYGMCVFADNTECEEWALLRGTCAPGQNPVSK
jgi:putative hemolysin